MCDAVLGRSNPARSHPLSTDERVSSVGKFLFFFATSLRWDGEQGDLELCRHLMAVVFSVTFLGVIGILEVSLSWHV